MPILWLTYNCLPKAPNDFLTATDTLCTIRDAGSYCPSGRAACTAPKPVEESSLVLSPTQDVLAFRFTQSIGQNNTSKLGMYCLQYPKRPTRHSSSLSWFINEHILPLSSHGRRDEGALWVFLIRAPIPLMRASLSCPNHLSKVSPPNTVTLGIRFQHKALGGTQIFGL